MIALAFIGILLLLALIALVTWGPISKERQRTKAHRDRWRDSRDQPPS
jgi:type II secretory pathway component PulM